MAFTRSVMVIFLFLGVLQVTNASTIEEIEAEVYNAANSTMKDVMTHVSMLQMVANNISGTAKQNIQFAYQNIAGTVNEALQAGVNITDCNVTAKNEIAAALNTSDAGIAICLDIAQEAVQPYVQPLTTDVETAQLVATSAAANYSACDSTNITCQDVALANAEEQKDTVINQLKTDRDIFFKNFWTIHGNLTRCALDHCYTAISTGYAALTEEKSCIQALLTS